MASKRALKRDLINQVTVLFNYALELRDILPLIPEQAEPLEEIMDDIIVFSDDSIRRIKHTDGAKNPKLVRNYYSKLRTDIVDRLRSFEERLDAILNSLVTPPNQEA